ncbi:Predicted lipoprotein with conserved Yx(FWY)xxD motif [Streptomyces sp. TLI_053]|uniref:hypothetical protein n=1 Tax=Streptomyces sp. TLI_053 TaxID=1855352 RepID=UPI00087A3ACB|nr:hypothetical protein [Streptomyces sp. TLI_053]SDT82972.1 Predicted lipoprotein with conserved Yx(FWY)xxD motif [Streptomyces sp. TLI_053]
MNVRFARSVLTGTTVLAVMVSAGCGSQGGTSRANSADGPGVLPQDGMPGMETPGGTPGPGGLVVKQDGALGSFLTDALGNALYVFDKDSTSPPKSACDSACTATWIPFPPVDNTVQWPGVTGQVGTLVREDRSSQLTVGGHPVYRFVKDTTPGDTNGKSVANWSLAAPDGTKAGKGSGQGKESPQGKETAQRTKEPEGDRGTRAPDRPADRETSRRDDRRESERADVRLTVVFVPAVGHEVLTLGGRVLYVNGDRLAVGTGRRCVGSCLRDWVQAPVVDLERVAQGIDRLLVREILVEDGSRQLAVNGHRVFTFSADSAVTDAKGNGRDGCWWPISPKGEPVRSVAAS